MRCLSCNKRLTDRESVRKYASSATFIDLCNQCFSEVAEEIPDIDDGTGVDLPDCEEEYGLSTNEFNPYQYNDDES